MCGFNTLVEKMTVQRGENEVRSSGNSGFNDQSREFKVVGQNLDVVAFTQETRTFCIFLTSFHTCLEEKNVGALPFFLIYFLVI